MSTTKLLISGLPNSGKTTLLQDLTDVLVFARDGKKYPFEQPHVNVPDFDYVGEILELMEDKINAYKAKYGKYPKTLVIDSLSKMLLDIEGSILEKVKSFPYGQINTEIKRLVGFLEDISEQFNIIMVSHAMLDADTDTYNLVNAGGSWGKKGGILSEVDQAIFVEIKGKKRTIHLRNPKMASRTTLKDLPDKVDGADFNLQKHIDTLLEKQQSANIFSL